MSAQNGWTGMAPSWLANEVTIAAPLQKGNEGCNCGAPEKPNRGSERNKHPLHVPGEEPLKVCWHPANAFECIRILFGELT